MKKIIATIAVIAMASFASAAAFSWGNTVATSNKVKFDGANTGAGVTATLVYLGNTSLVDISEGVNVGTTQTIANSVFGGTFNVPYNTTIPGTSDAFVDGATFGVYLTYEVDGATWYNFAQSTYTVTGINEGGDTAALAKYTIIGANFGSWATIGEVETLDTTKGGWQTVKTAVPEPATALIGLLGLGLMIKRRK